jgi:hypothetical protein
LALPAQLYVFGTSIRHPPYLPALAPIDARAHGQLSYKATTFAEIQAFSEISLHIARESEMHVEVCPEYLTPA